MPPPDSRKTHITRILGTNRKGERLTDVYADVERMDIIKSQRNGQGVQRKLRWCDDPDADDYFVDGNPSRITEIVKLCDAETEPNVNDPEIWVPLPVVKGLKSRGGDGYMDRFLNDATGEDAATSRVFEVRRIVHYDTNIDDAAQAAFDADPERTEYVVPAAGYAKDDDPKARDAGQYLEQEILTFVKSSGNIPDTMGVGRQTKLLNQYLLDESEDATQKVVGQNGFNPPYRLDPFQNVKNISWGGLAVEFSADGLSYLEMPGGIPDFSKGTFAFWFRVPQSSIDAAKAFFDADDVGVPLSGIIPLITLGRKGELQRVTAGHAGTDGDADAVIIGTNTRHDMVPDTSSNPVTGYTEASGSPTTTSEVWINTVENGDLIRTNPTCIGIDCSGDTPKLYVNFETLQKPTVVGEVYDQTAYTATDRWSYNPTTVTDSIGFHFVPHPDIPDFDVEVSVADASMVGYRTAAYTASAAPTITAGRYYQATVSFDLTVACETHGTITSTTDAGPVDPVQSVKDGTVSAPKIWVALNGENQTGKNLSQYWPDGADDGNIVLTPEAYVIATKQNISGGTGHLENFPGASDPQPFNTSETISGVEAPSYSVGPSSIPTNGASIGIPAAAEFSNVIQTVEMGELYIIPNFKLDTGNASNLRAFIDENGYPVPPSEVAEQLGITPDIILHRSGRWRLGKNTGSLASPDGKRNAFDFDPTGEIKNFRPGPSLFGPQ